MDSQSPHYPFCIYEEQMVCLVSNKIPELCFYSSKGLEGSVFIHTKNQQLLETDHCGILQTRQHYFYFSSFNQMVIANASGDCKTIEFDHPIHSFALSNEHPSGIWIVISTEDCFLHGKLEGDSIAMSPRRFARDFPHARISFLNTEHFALIGEKEIRIFHIHQNGPTQVKLISSKSKVIAVLPTSTYNECAVIETSGTISLHKHGN